MKKIYGRENFKLVICPALRGVNLNKNSKTNSSKI